MQPAQLPEKDFEDTDDDELEEPRDPLLRAFGAGENTSLIVFETNAIRHSALGEGFLNCLGENAQEGLSKIQNELGINPLEDIDRMALGDETVMFSGHFDNLQWEEIFENREQIEISKYYESLPKPTLMATEEFLQGQVYHRNPSKDVE